MKKETGVTLVALVVTIIILIILAGVSMNTLIGEDGILTKVKQGKQNIILAGEAEAMQLNQLYYELENGGDLSEDEEGNKKDEMISLLQKQVEELQKQIVNLQTENKELQQQIEGLSTQITQLQQEIMELRKQLASKEIEITELKKQVSEKETKIQDLQNQLNSLNSLLSQTNSTADKILSGYKAYSGGKLLTGTMTNQGAISSSLNCGQSYNIPAGYHNGSGKVTANSLASQTAGTATANNLSNGTTAWVNGDKIIGNGTDINNAYNNGYNQGKQDAESLHAITISNLIVGGKIYDRDIYPYCVINTSSYTSMTFNMAAAHPYCYFYVIGTKGSVEATLFSQVPSTSLSDFEKSLTFDIAYYDKITFKTTPYGGMAGGVIISNLVIS